MKSVCITAIPGIPLVEPGDDLAALILAAIGAAGLDLVSGDIVVVAQKIVSKAEGRYVRLADVVPTPEAVELAAEVRKDPRHVQVVLSESTEVVRRRENILIVAHKLGLVMANAGVDESNVDHAADGHRLLLLPRDPDGSAAELKRRFDREGVEVGVIINDSFGRPWRNGVVGVALGAAGVPALVDLVGAPDLFGRAMRVTETALADEIASAASLVMGQSDEGLPVVLVRGFASRAPVRPASALIRPRERDMFR
jgi:coenzyme F420-0:L-glutamate ligase/coenzyme F420-1:gamma-L-glutamate ligase